MSGHWIPKTLDVTKPPVLPGRQHVIAQNRLVAVLRRRLERLERPKVGEKRVARAAELRPVLRRCRRHTRPCGRAQPFTAERSSHANDADRLRKYLARFGVDWSDLRPRLADRGTG